MGQSRNIKKPARQPGDLTPDARRHESATLSWSCVGRTLRCVVRWPANRPPLADVLPLFEQLGLRLLDHQQLEAVGDIFTFVAESTADDETMELLSEAFLASLERRCDRDVFASLASAARLHARQIQLVRVAFAYLRQAGLGASRQYVRDILMAHPEFVRGWVDAFESRFDPASTGTRDRLDALVEQATTSDADKVLRWFTGFVRSATRTSYFQHTDEAHAGTIVVKLDPSRMAFLAAPRALVETFVHHPDMEGLHVRHGRIARGGVRWSDRLEDFRTEVLALVRAQQVKNALIVPAGAKGAFVVKAPLAALDADAVALELRRCYRLFVRGLLDITDNVVDGAVVHPRDTVVLDGDDPYLVVAADKGTAAFPDLANAEAEEAGFWLGDAFASGGSTGYDHRGLGVTARGAWTSVRRHFSDLGDAFDRAFTAVGIGDMSGDVFGNGMLLSRHLRLVAAFDHRHLFLDPAPDPDRSFAERRRLAALARSSWADYSPDAFSAGGGVFPRTARKVPISPQAQRALGIAVDALTPDELVRAILCAPVDLLWNGGVGTFVRAAHETDADVGDRANDRVRVQADQLRCRMVVEGGNLGLTQAARIEYALAGGRINADFIDNAGGVNTSDREVNLKILLHSVVAAGEIDGAERNRILAACTADVVDAVLADNARQNWAVSVAEAHGPFLLDRHESVIRNITEVAGLDRKSAQLPSDQQVAHRRTQGRGFTRPEIAVLLSHAKNVLSVELAAGDVPDDPAVRDVLMDYFPTAVRVRFPAHIGRHRLGREIVCTQLANHAIDHLGPGFLHRLEDRSGVPSAECLRGYLVVSDLLGFHEVWHGLDTVPLAVSIPIRRAVERTVDHNVCWLLRRTGSASGAGARDELAPHIQRLRSWLESSSEPVFLATVNQLIDGGAARLAAVAPRLFPAFDLAAAAAEARHDVVTVATSYFEMPSQVDLDWLLESLPIAPQDSHTTQLAKAALADELCAVRVRLAVQALRDGGWSAWEANNASALRRVRALAADVARSKSAAPADMAALALGVQLMRDLTGRE